MAADPDLEQIYEQIPEDCARAVFAGGCFWCLEAAFEALEGVKGAISGYAGGQPPAPTYQEVCGQQTDHREAVLVYYDPAKISYQELLEAFWRSIDPFDAGGQFFDRGLSYTTAVFYLDDSQKSLAIASKAELEKKFKKPMASDILAYTTFFEAEAYHQSFYRNYPERYQSYVGASNREEFKKRVWAAIVEEEQSPS